MLLTTKQVHESLGISRETFMRWGVPVAEKDKSQGNANLYRLSDIVANREANRERIVRAELEGEDPGDMDAARLELLAERIETQKLKNAGLRQELGPISIVKDILAKCASEINAILDSLALTLKRKIPRLDAREIEIAKVEIAKAQNAMSGIEVDVEQAVSRYYERAA